MELVSMLLRSLTVQTIILCVCIWFLFGAVGKGFSRLKKGEHGGARLPFIIKLVAKALLLSFLVLFLMGSCGVIPFFQSDDQRAMARLERVIAAIEHRDKKSLRGMFSQKALAEAEDLDRRMDYLFDFVQGRIFSWKKEAAEVNDSVSGWQWEKTTRYRFTVTTDQEKYLFFLLEYPLDTTDFSNMGLYMLQVIKLEDRDTQFSWGYNNLCAGIYKPEALGAPEGTGAPEDTDAPEDADAPEGTDAPQDLEDAPLQSPDPRESSEP